MSRASVAIKGFVIDSLDRHLPRRTKRLLFLASFFASVKDEKEPSFDDPALQKLNQLMRLSNTDSALKLPVHLSRVIWRGRTFNEICGDPMLEGQLTPDRLDGAAHSIISFMPKWLQYGRPEDIEKDVKQLLMHRQIFTVGT
ncbi:MAG: hypothetical protein P4L77_11410 [Sulfuriferula sp.]|nr:hypothetical protein [Sulfuriferula sp.]